MSLFLEDFKHIIREASYDNTYKMAWARALVEYSFSNTLNDSDELVKIDIEDLAKLMLKYYWNQTIYFNLVQGSNLEKPPLLVQYVKELIKIYQDKIKDYRPIAYERVMPVLVVICKDEYERILKKSIWAIKQNVAYRFIYLNKKIYDDVYKYEIDSNYLFMKSSDSRELKENHYDLFDLISYRWSLILETFNTSPRINKKVKVLDEDIIRTNLKKFDKYLDYENKEHICFICGKKIEDKDLSRDHVISWSYLYSDDLWNLVYVHKSCNSSKSDIIPSQEEVNKLKERNNVLISILDENCIKGKDVDNLKLAMKNNYIDSFYIGCKEGK
jgi:hypothetical protein